MSPRATVTLKQAQDGLLFPALDSIAANTRQHRLMINTATPAPAPVPSTWAKLRLSVMPASGRLMMTTVIRAHFGWSRSKMKARYRQSNPAATVRNANSRTSRPGRRAILK